MTGARVDPWPIRDRPDLDEDTLLELDTWWRAANYLSVGQIYLLANPLLREPLTRDHIKPRLLGHWGTTPGLNLIYAHLNRVIRERSLSTIYIAGPGHGGPGMVANAYLDGTYTELYSSVDRTEEGLRNLFRQFSFPGGIPSHAAPETPGIHPRGRRTRLLALARLRRRVRQPRPARGRRGRRRRGGDRAARDQLALQQVRRPAAPTASCCRSCTSTATRSPIPPCSRASPSTSCSTSCADTATRRTSSPAASTARTRSRCTGGSRKPWMPRSTRSRRSRLRPPTAPSTAAPPGR